MEIDLFTLVAQIFNFLLLLFLLRRFLYNPIINVMEERERKIAARIEEADQKLQAAEEKGRAYDEQRRDLEKNRASMLDEAKVEAEKRRHELIEKARADINEMQSGWYRSLERERETFLRELRRRVGLEVCRVARRALADLADAELEQQVIEVFIERLNSVDDKEWDKLNAGTLNSDGAVKVVSAFELEPEVQEQLTRLVQDRLKSHVDFVTNSELMCGLRLQTENHEIAWDFEHYLDALEARFGEVLDVKT